MMPRRIADLIFGLSKHLTPANTGARDVDDSGTGTLMVLVMAMAMTTVIQNIFNKTSR